MRFLCALLLAFGLTAAPAGACGDVVLWTEAYLKGAASDANRRTALVELTGVCGTYVGIDSDRRLLVVLLDAERRGYERPLLRKVLETYKCLPNLPSSADRARLIGALEARCP